MASFKDGREAVAGGDTPEMTREGSMFEKFPNLFECLFGYRLPNGTDRPGCKISLWGEQDRVKICVNDADTEMIGFGVLEKAKSVADSLEKLLAEGPIEWKPNKFAQKGGRK